MAAALVSFQNGQTSLLKNLMVDVIEDYTAVWIL
jgi:hypothetical protein